MLYNLKINIAACASHDPAAVQPCPDLTESCVQEYFQEQVQCTPAVQESGAAKFDTITMKIPSTKMIIDQLNTTIDEVDGKIVAFT